MIRFPISLVAMSLAVTPAVARQTNADPVAAATAPAAPAAPAAAPAKPKKVCRTQTVTGRRIAQTECHTAEQWAAYDKATNEAANKLVENVGRAEGKVDFGSSTNSLFGFGPQ